MIGTSPRSTSGAERWAEQVLQLQNSAVEWRDPKLYSRTSRCRFGYSCGLDSIVVIESVSSTYARSMSYGDTFKGGSPCCENAGCAGYLM
jgi:hypothetical protein